MIISPIRSFSLSQSCTASGAKLIPKVSLNLIRLTYILISAEIDPKLIFSQSSPFHQSL